MTDIPSEQQIIQQPELNPLSRAVKHGLAYGTLIAASSAMVATPAFAQSDSGELMLEEVIVTAQKREQNMQDVPIAVTAFNSQKIEELGIQGFQDYALMIPNLSFKSLGSPATATIYMRGASDGGDGNASGSTPSTGLYLDEQSVTTIGSNLDIHIYDIARIEALGGPQGTLFGASSQSGTVRIITNKPDTQEFAAGFDVTGTGTKGGDGGYSLEGFVNFPIGERAALRVVGWHVDEGGWIDNVPGSRTYNLEWGYYNYDPNAPYGRTKTINNDHLVDDNFNTLKKTGLRAALKVDLSDSWTGTLSVITQETDAKGMWEHDPRLGDHKIQRYYEDFQKDDFTQLALTIEGEVGNHQIVYAGSILDRQIDYQADYTAYGEYASFVPYYACDYSATGPDLGTQSNTDCTSLEEFYVTDQKFDRTSHELRVVSNHEGRINYTAGLYYEKNENDYFLQWWQPFMSPTLAVPPYDDLYFRTDQVRVDKQKAVFGELTFDFTETFSGTVGFRYFDEDHEVQGVVGWGPGVFCPSSPGCRDTNADSKTSTSDTIFKGNLNWRATDDVMLYVTYSEGYRPGGLNRDPGLPSQAWTPDILTNYEFGWKTTLAGGRVRWNGAAYYMDWDNIQYTVYDFALSPCCGSVYNLSTAEVKGFETDITILVNENFTLSAAVAYNKGKTTDDFILPVGDGKLTVPDGTELPNVPKWKGNIIARYNFAVADLPAYAQFTWSYTDGSYSEIRPSRRSPQGSYNIANLRSGVNNTSWGVDLFINNLFDEVADLYVNSRPYEIATAINRPRNYGAKYWMRF